MRLSDGTRFDLERKILTFYDSSKPYPHCHTNVHLNEVRVDKLKHLPIGEIVELLSHVDNNYQSPDPLEKSRPKIKTRQAYTQLLHELNWWWSISETNLTFERWLYHTHHNQHYIYYKHDHSKNKSTHVPHTLTRFETDVRAVSRMGSRRSRTRRRHARSHTRRERVCDERYPSRRVVVKRPRSNQKQRSCQILRNKR